MRTAALNSSYIRPKLNQMACDLFLLCSVMILARIKGQMLQVRSVALGEGGHITQAR